MIKKQINKRGDIAVVVFVSLVLVLCVFTLVRFTSTKTKIIQNLNGLQAAEEMILEEKDLTLILKEISRGCLISVYNYYFQEMYYSPPSEREDYSLVRDRDPRFNENLNKELDFCIKYKSEGILKNEYFLFTFFKKEFQTHKEFERFLQKINKQGIKTEISPKEIRIILPNFNISYSSFEINKEVPAVNGIKNTDIVTTLNFKQEGLISPEELFEIADFCKSNKYCYEERLEKLFKIEVFEVEEKENLFRVNLKTVHEYLIEEDFSYIEFDLYTEKQTEEIKLETTPSQPLNPNRPELAEPLI